jgi:hypothetical protein
MLRRTPGSRGSGTVVAAGIVLTACTLGLAGFGAHLGWIGAWRLIGVPAKAPPFVDLHGVTDFAACAAKGIDVYLYHHCTMVQGGYNYPPIWLLLGRLGVGSEYTPWLAVLIILPPLGLMVALFSGWSIRMGLIALFAILSPSVMLAFERGNIDLVEWSLVCAAALVFSGRRASRVALALALLVVAVALKLIAMFCCAVTVRLKRQDLIVAGTLFAFASGYLYVSIIDVYPLMRRNTHLDTDISFGYIPLFGQIESRIGPLVGVNLAGLTRSWEPLTAVGIVVVAATLIALFFAHRDSQICKIEDDHPGTAFLFGGGIFLGCFLFLQTNYAYRLIFLLLCLPQLFAWIEKGSERKSRHVAWLLLASCLLTMWLKLAPFGIILRPFNFLIQHSLELRIIGQIADWVLFGSLIAIFLANALYARRGAGDRSPREGLEPSSPAL